MSADYFSSTLEVAPYRYSASWLIGAQSHATDRFEADVERIFQPDRDHVGGTIRFSLSKSSVEVRPKERGSRRLKLLNRLRPPKLTDLADQIFFDVRSNQYFNWSHQVNFFLSLALAARSSIQLPMIIVIPSGMPRAAFELYNQFGFDVVATDGPVRGRHFDWSVSHIEVVPSARPQLISRFMFEHDNDPRVFPTFDLPRRVFLSRRKTRSLLNEVEIERVLNKRGFVKVYAEDLNIPQQFSLFRQADHVVAIHGAGLAPLQYRSPSKPGICIVELAPAGIVTRWFGIMCEQVGGKYIAVRGKLKPEYIEGLYAEEPFERYCDDNFEIDPKSLEVALGMIGSP